MAEMNIPEETGPGAFTTMLRFADRITKGFAVFAGTVYVAGYITIATRLALYGVPTTTRLIDAQYITAGFLPALLIWLTISIVISGYHYNPRRTDDGLPTRRWKLANSAFAILLVLLLVPLFISGNHVREIWTPRLLRIRMRQLARFPWILSFRPPRSILSIGSETVTAARGCSTHMQYTH